MPGDTTKMTVKLYRSRRNGRRTQIRYSEKAEKLLELELLQK